VAPAQAGDPRKRWQGRGLPVQPQCASQLSVHSSGTDLWPSGVPRVATAPALTSHTVSAHGERGASGAAADQRYPIGCAAAPAGAGHGGERRLYLRGRSPTIRGPGLEAAAHRRPISPRCRSARRKAIAALPRRRGSSGTVPAESSGPSTLAELRARLASGQSGRTAQHP
jgi:hypothetical protein